MSGLFRRLSSRRSDGPEGEQPPAQAEPGATDAPANAPAEAGGHQSLLVDPAAPTRVLRDDDAPTTFQRPGEQPAAGEGTTAELTGAPGGSAAGGSPAGAAPGDGSPDADTAARGLGGSPDAGTGMHPGSVGSPEAASHGTPAEHGAMAPVDPASTLHPVVHAPEPGVPYAGPGGERPMFPVSDLPAGVDPDELAAAPPTSARRSRLRKRVSFLRAAREVLMRDLGGFVYELHRTAGDIEHEAHRRLREVKLARLTRLDTELHELELRLDDVRRHVVVREPGVGGECPHCGELFGSDAHYCSHCGLPLTESARRAVAHEAQPPALEAAPPEAAPPHDQPTEEYSPLAAGDTEFRWPTRGAAMPGDEATAVTRPDGAEASGEGATAITRPDGEETTGAATSRGGEESATAADPDTPESAEVDEGAAAETTSAKSDEGASAKSDEGASAKSDEGASAKSDEGASAGGDEGASAVGGEADVDAPAVGGEAPKEREVAGGREPEAGARGEEPSGPEDAAAPETGAPNGRDESVFSPLERRR